MKSEGSDTKINALQYYEGITISLLSVDIACGEIDLGNALSIMRCRKHREVGTNRSFTCSHLRHTLSTSKLRCL